jgi:hypothetical protein
MRLIAGKYGIAAEEGKASKKCDWVEEHTYMYHQAKQFLHIGGSGYI